MRLWARMILGMHTPVVTSHGRMVAQPIALFLVGGSNHCQLPAIGGAAAMCA